MFCIEMPVSKSLIALFAISFFVNCWNIALGDPPRPVVKVVADGESKTPPSECLTTIVGTGLNEPESYPGYGGFVGWVEEVPGVCAQERTKGKMIESRKIALREILELRREELQKSVPATLKEELIYA